MDAQSASRKVDKSPAPKVKRAVYLDTETSLRLDVQALGMGLSASALLEKLILAHCQDFELKFRGGGGR